MTLYEQLLIHNDCYVAGKILNPIGVMVHSTGANNPYLLRYVPGNDIIGRNTGGNHWDQSNEQWQAKFGKPLNKCVHAFIGKTADGSVAVVQTLPWAMRGWHAGKSKGNNRYIGFEICEDGMEDPVYFAAVYRAAAELTAYLCRLYGWDPLADGVVICHAEGFKRGIASNHGDIVHWWSKFNYTMDDFRRDVAERMEDDNMTQEKFDEMMANYLERRAKLPPSDWAEKNLKDAVSLGFTDGTRAQDFCTRQETALMIRAAVHAQ